MDLGVTPPRVERGAARVVDLVRLADDAGVTITSVDLRRPPLETVFLSVVNPLTYGVDGLRAVRVGAGTYLFERVEAV